MRYLLRCGNKAETIARREYLEQTFHLWFVEKGTIDSFIVLESIPLSAESDICLIYGHNTEVATLLKNHRESIPEKNIFIIACLTNNPKDFIVPCKKVFIAPQKRGEGVKLRNGTEFGFDFDISDVELNLFNSHTQDTLNKLTSVFDRIQTL